MKRILITSLWLIAGAGVTVLLIAAVNGRNHQVCKGYDIDINGQEKGDWFIDKADIVRVITNNGTVSIRNKKLESFNLHSLEAKLESEVWIKDAEMYFDNNGVLKVNVTEREPVARIFSSLGASFYIDSSGHRLPLSDKMSARVPVFTGFPGEGKKIRSQADKKLITQIKEISRFLQKDPYWMAQLAQIDINHSREFEMIPTVGNYIIEFGSSENCNEKFHRLMIFYKQVLSKTGTDKYERIKVQYDRQVIGVKKQNN